MRRPEPWERAGRGWYVQIDGKQVPLGRDKDDAVTLYHKLMAARSDQRPSVSLDGITVAEVCDRFILWCRANRAKATAEAVLERLAPFALFVGDLAVQGLRPHHVTSWIASNAGWASPTTRRDRIDVVKRAMRWAVREGLVNVSPIEAMQKPSAGRRDNPLTPAEFADALACCRRQELRDLLTVCWETGCRMQEITRVEARHLAGQRWVFPESEAKGKKRVKIVYLTPLAADICERLAARHPKGPIFRNSQGIAWNKFNLHCALTRLGERTGKSFCLTDLRHSFATEMSKAGVDPLTLAALMGHVDGSMVAKVYSHMGRDESRLFEQLGRRST
jgi:integrase